MNVGIVWIDMHIRDERMLTWLKSRGAEGGRFEQIRHDEIAVEFKCHPNTVSAILRRLEGVGAIKVDRRAKCGGYSYSVVVQ